MPLALSPCALVRRVYVVRGEVDFRMWCRPAFDYARVDAPPRPAAADLARFTATDGSAATELALERAHGGRGPGGAPARFTLRGRRGRLVRPAARRRRRALVATTPSRARHRADPRPLAPLGDPHALRRALARDGPALGHHAQALHLHADRRDGRRAHHAACPRRSAAGATGTTATPGCATRPSPPSPSSAWASTTRPCAFNDWLEAALPRDRPRRPPAPDRLRHRRQPATSPSSSWPTSRATAARGRCASATAPTTSSSSTSTAS